MDTASTMEIMIFITNKSITLKLMVKMILFIFTYQIFFFVFSIAGTNSDDKFHDTLPCQKSKHLKLESVHALCNF